MNWLCESLQDGRSGRYSSRRLAMLLATASMSAGLIILCVAQLLGRDAAMAIGAVAVPLAGLGGYSYVNGKVNEAKNAISSS